MSRRAWVLALVATACSSGGESSSSLGLDQPIRVRSAQLVEGDLPGSAPTDDDAGAAAPGAHVTILDTANRVIRSGEVGKAFSGRATTDAQTVGVRFADLGSAFWVVPVGGPDTTANDELTWSMTADFARDVPPGLHPLRFAAIDANGASGPQFELPVCVAPDVPDNLHACDPKLAPPSAVISLRWDAPVDLDLRVRLPDGSFVDAKRPGNLATLDGGTASSPGAVVIDRDSNAGCAIDGRDLENAVMQSSPPSGSYAVWVDLFDACSQPAVRFTLSLWLAEDAGDGTKRQVEHPLASGELLRDDATGGAGPGLFVTELVLQ